MLDRSAVWEIAHKYLQSTQGSEASQEAAGATLVLLGEYLAAGRGFDCQEDLIRWLSPKPPSLGSRYYRTTKRRLVRERRYIDEKIALEGTTSIEMNSGYLSGRQQWPGGHYEASVALETTLQLLDIRRAVEECHPSSHDLIIAAVHGEIDPADRDRLYRLRKQLRERVGRVRKM